MGPTNVQTLWKLAEIQHGVLSRGQLLAAGLTPDAIRHRLEEGRLHRVYPGVYAVGRPELSQLGRWIAAVLACGEGAVLSHASAAELWGVKTTSDKGLIHVTVPSRRRGGHDGIRVHRRDLTPAEIAKRQGIPLTAIATTLVDQAATISRKRLEAQVNEADKLDLADPETLRAELDRIPSRPGIRKLRALLDEATLVLTDSELERLFLPIAKRVGLPKPETRKKLCGFRPDFHWPDLNLVVETDGLRYHRTPQQQTTDRLRDQKLTAAGKTVLRFTHAQVKYQPDYVRATLIAVVQTLRSAGYSARKRGRRAA
jgi:very-short-patch-repair endonuclease/predicted transcriptional regulator of viral defense system